MKIIREFSIAESAKRGAARDEFNKMFHWVKKNARKENIHAILAHKLDRVCRNMRDAVRLQELEDDCGVRLAFVENEFGPGAAGQLSFNVMAAVAQYYSDTRRAFLRALRARTRDTQDITQKRLTNLQQQLSRFTQQEDRLLNLRLNEEIEAVTFTKKSTEIRDEIDRTKALIEDCDRQRVREADTTIKVFELSQALEAKWVTADIAEKRRLMEIICLNWTLDGITLVPAMRKPFDVLAEGPSLMIGRGKPALFEPLARRYAEIVTQPAMPYLLAAKTLVAQELLPA